MNNYIKQIWFELRHQPMVTVTSVLGTSLSIFLVMAVFMVSSLDTTPVAPESNRSRLLTGMNIHVKTERGESSGSLSYDMAQKIYGNLEGIEMTAFSNGWGEAVDASVNEGDCIGLPEKKVDDVFWKIFDFTFIDGKPFDKATVESGVKKVILSESAARKLFGTANATGKEMKLNHVPYTVQGVVKDTSPLLTQSYASVYTPYSRESADNLWIDGLGGDTKVYMLMKDDASYEDIKSQVISRYATLDAALKKENKELVYHGAPYTSEALGMDFGSNTDPDTETPRRYRYGFYFILLLLPAINLSSLTRSRLRRRVSEIGVRRAYGASKKMIMTQFLGENLLMTLAGGVIGFILCVAFIVLFSNLFLSYGWNVTERATPSIEMLLNFKTFGMALLMCLILNLLSTGMPSWNASRVNPAEAISGKND